MFGKTTQDKLAEFKYDQLEHKLHNLYTRHESAKESILQLNQKLEKVGKIRDWWFNEASVEKCRADILTKELQAYKDYDCPKSELRAQFAEVVRQNVAKNNKVAELELSLSEVCKQRNEFEATNLELRKENARLSKQIDNYLNHPAPNKSTKTEDQKLVEATEHACSLLSQILEILGVKL